jgi:hypothetical protein
MRYVMVGFHSDEDALRFLEHINGLDEMGRELTIAEPTKAKKVRLKRFKIRTAYLRDIKRVDEDA